MMLWFKDETMRKDFQFALYCLPGLAIVYAIGFWFGDMLYASVAAGGALTVGWGANKKLMDYPLAPMIIAGIGMSVSAFVGSLAGNFYPVYLALCLLWGSVCALVGVLDQNAWWVTLQWSIALFVAGYYPGDVLDASARAALVFGGGAVQFLCILFFLRKLKFHRNLLDVEQVLKVMLHIHNDIDKKLRFHKVGWQAVGAIILSLALVYLFQIPAGYWATMTAMLVIKPNWQNTFARARDRVLGTLLGIIIADVLALISVEPHLMVLEILFFAFWAYAFASRPYTILTTFITISAVLMFALSGQPEPQVALERIIATTIGGLSALGAMGLSRLHHHYVTHARAAAIAQIKQSGAAKTAHAAQAQQNSGSALADTTHDAPSGEKSPEFAANHALWAAESEKGGSESVESSRG